MIREILKKIETEACNISLTVIQLHKFHNGTAVNCKNAARMILRLVFQNLVTFMPLFLCACSNTCITVCDIA